MNLSGSGTTAVSRACYYFTTAFLATWSRPLITADAFQLSCAASRKRLIQHSQRNQNYFCNSPRVANARRQFSSSSFGPSSWLPVDRKFKRMVSSTTAVAASAADASAVEPTDTLDIAANLLQVRERMETACQQIDVPAQDVRLVAVSKTKPIELLQSAYDAGQRVFGENYAQELVQKVPQLPDPAVTWHFIGALQSNKANLLVNAVKPDVRRLVIETVASQKLANKLNNAVKQAETEYKLRVFTQVNTSGEDSKSGVTPGKACVELCQHILTECPHLELAGLMTIGAAGDLSCFETLKSCREEVAKEVGVDVRSLELSMGMSGDYEAAILAGATNVRVGSTIFGARDYSNVQK